MSAHFSVPIPTSNAYLWQKFEKVDAVQLATLLHRCAALDLESDLAQMVARITKEAALNPSSIAFDHIYLPTLKSLSGMLESLGTKD